MATLRFKAKIYQYTGIYLANPEKVDYVSSQEFSNDVRAILKYSDLSELDEVISIAIGSWDSDNGFHRRYVRGQFSSNPLIRAYAWCKVFILKLKEDLCI